MSVFINPETRAVVQKRSRGVCEYGCVDVFGMPRKAVHLHHFTYERAGNELPKDLAHICVVCHMHEHPEKAESILAWEMNRRTWRMRDAADDETEELEATNEEGWNLGKYHSIGYCMDDIEQEEMRGAPWR